MRFRIAILLCLYLLMQKRMMAQNDTLSIISPFSFNASYIGDGLRNFNGGLKKGSCYLGTANLRVLFNTEKANFWNGGQVFINGANTHGSEPSAVYVGDVQGISNIEAGSLTYLHEFWYRQEVGRFTTIVGLQDLNSEFLSSETAGLFLNGSFGTHSTISDNIHAPIFPLTAFGVQIQYRFFERISAKVAMFDGFLDDFDSNPNNLKWRLRKKEGITTFAEFSFDHSFIRELSGIYKVGAYMHHHFCPSNCLSDCNLIGNVFGLYFMGDQTLFSNVNGRRLSAFSQLSYSPSLEVKNNYYLGFGFNYKGLLKKRSKDVLGAAIARAGFQNYEVSHETSIELTYKAMICDNVFVQSDFQYIVHPSGTNMKLKNASVAILRFGFNF